MAPEILKASIQGAVDHNSKQGNMMKMRHASRALLLVVCALLDSADAFELEGAIGGPAAASSDIHIHTCTCTMYAIGG